MKRQFCFVALLLFAQYHLTIGQTFPSGFTRVLVSGNIVKTTALAFGPDGRIFITQQTGQVRIIKDGVLLPTPLISLTVDEAGERGLIGIAIDPAFEVNNFIYVYYTVPGVPAHNRVSRFTVSGDLAELSSEFVLVELDPLSNAAVHNGGALAFGKDGRLYVGVGDNSNSVNAQKITTYHGKILRLNPDGSIPEDNPFVAGGNHAKLIWALGVRNPFSISVNADNGKIFVNDVGANLFEEVNDITTGGNNYGWPDAEGVSANPEFVNPVYSYPHVSGDVVGCAITGGNFFTPPNTNYPAQYYGKYFFMDFCEEWINFFDPSTEVNSVSFASEVATRPLYLSSGSDGNLYFLSRVASIYKIVYDNSSPPTVIEQPVLVEATEGYPASFRVRAIGTAPFSYQWMKNDTALEGATEASFTIHQVTPEDNGEYRVVVTNAVGSVSSNLVLLSVTPINDPPVATIVSPVMSDTYIAGNKIDFLGLGSDPEDGELTPARMSWQIDFHNGDQVSTLSINNGVSQGSVIIPNTGEKSVDVFYRFTFMVSDTEGLTDSKIVEIRPKLATLILDTEPSGLRIMFDDRSIVTPFEVKSVQGMQHQLSAEKFQFLADTAYEFFQWAHGASQTHSFNAPLKDMTYLARFRKKTITITGLDSNTLTTSYAIYPNPTQGNIVFSIPSTVPHKFKVTIGDAMGKIVKVFNLELEPGNNEVKLDVGDLPNGFLFVDLNGRQKSRILKF